MRDPLERGCPGHRFGQPGHIGSAGGDQVAWT
jgi:hypothetical protein